MKMEQEKKKISTPKIAKQGWGRGLRSGQSKYQKEKRRKKEKIETIKRVRYH